ncbi:prepilin peptidase [Anaerosporobacter sp.]|uniref:prepilin peptidase n=1 Tax=Anaerosporobacter sp. TaxID=1872529 RepID=UPI00286EE7F1|nr:prepilin peptidase [Anaerosporobacter sp.]
MQLFYYIVVFLYGIVIGSFLNVCIYRIPKKEDLVKAHSHCMTCGHILRWYELIPVFSYLFQRGRCRGCGIKIAIQYPLVETLNGVCYLIIIHRMGITPEGILLCLLCSALLVLSVIDFRTYTIPFGINISVLAIGIMAIAFDYKNVSEHLLGMVCVSGFLFALYLLTKKRGIGDGDIKLMIGAGAFLGVLPSILALWVACLLGAIIHTIRMKVSKVGHQLAFGPYLAIGILFSALYGEELIGRYMNYLIR